ncbi:MAG: glycosyltransferase [Sphingobacteriales bacterium]|nr:MAG: glycosyltransferase [Sphingobacteriales bacterium]
MKIGFVSIVREPWGGSEELWSAAAFELLRRGHEVFISIYRHPQPAQRVGQLEAAGARIVYRKGLIQQGLSKRSRVPKKAWNFISERVRNPYTSFFSLPLDLCVYTGACDSFQHDRNFLPALRNSKVPLVTIDQVNWEYTRSFDDYGAGLIAEGHQLARLNLFVAERNRTVLERFLAAPVLNSRVVRNPVNLSETGVLPWPPSGIVQIATVGNLLVNHKGQDLLLDVLRGHLWQQRDWHLNFYGTGIDRVYLERLCIFYDLQTRVTFHGKVADVRAIWVQNHLLAMPSRLEGTPLSMVEAMLCGRPVLMTDVGGNAEWVRDGHNGFLAEGANTTSLARTLERAWALRQHWPELGRQAFEDAQKRYDPSAGATLADLLVDAAH